MSSSRAEMLSDLRKSSEALAKVKEAETRAIEEFRDQAATRISATVHPSRRELERLKATKTIGRATKRSVAEVEQLLAIANEKRSIGSLNGSTSDIGATRSGA